MAATDEDDDHHHAKCDHDRSVPVRKKVGRIEKAILIRFEIGPTMHLFRK
jgi:hypothetical protein